MRSSWIAMLLCPFLLCGCFLAPAIDSFSKLGVTRSDRMNLLPQEIKRFHEALYWGRPDEAMSYLAPQTRSAVGKELVSQKRKERITDSSVESVDYSEDAYHANVEVVVKYLDLEQATNMVMERFEKQEWEFNLSDGWKLVNRSVSTTPRA